MPDVTINDNNGNNIPIKEYTKSVCKPGNWAREAEISMIPIVYNDIVVATYEVVLDNKKNNILGYRFIQKYGDTTNTSKSI